MSGSPIPEKAKVTGTMRKKAASECSDWRPDSRTATRYEYETVHARLRFTCDSGVLSALGVASSDMGAGVEVAL